MLERRYREIRGWEIKGSTKFLEIIIRNNCAAVVVHEWGFAGWDRPKIENRPKIGIGQNNLDRRHYRPQRVVGPNRWPQK